jgi:hypothetical protein
MPLAIWAMTAALAYTAGKQSMGRKAGDHARAKAFKRRMSARKARSRA